MTSLGRNCYVDRLRVYNDFISDNDKFIVQRINVDATGQTTALTNTKVLLDFTLTGSQKITHTLTTSDKTLVPMATFYDTEVRTQTTDDFIERAVSGDTVSFTVVRDAGSGNTIDETKSVLINFISV